jgi:hypothetical protein
MPGILAILLIFFSEYLLNLNAERRLVERRFERFDERRFERFDERRFERFDERRFERLVE